MRPLSDHPAAAASLPGVDGGARIRSQVLWLLATACVVGLVVGTAPAFSLMRSGAQIILGLGLLTAALFDLRVRRVPNIISLLLAAPATVLACLDTRLALSALAGLLSFLLLQIARVAYRRRRGREGLGGGDVKLIAVLMLALGPLTGAWMLAIAMAAAVAWLLTRRADAEYRLPFAPFLALATGLVLLVGGSA